MSDKQISVIIGFRDWGIDRLTLMLKSLRQSSIADQLDMVVSDYGSEDERAVREAVEGEGARVVRTPRKGPWSRSRALNAGVRATDTPYCITTDADMIFTDRCVEIARDLLEQVPRSLQLIQCRDLLEGMGQDTIHDFDFAYFERNSELRPRWGMGGFAAFSRASFDEIGGYDDRMEIYGAEDVDFAKRFRRNGMRLNWIDSVEARIFHIWHPPTRDYVVTQPEQLAAREINRNIMINDKTWVRNYWSPPAQADAPPVVSIAIATHNRAKYLSDSINSVLAQTNQNFEILIGDDGSTDNTEEVVAKFDDARIRYFKLAKSGVAAVRNVLTQNARGKFICIHDDDDIMLPDRIETQLSAMRSPYAGNYGGWIDFDNQDGQLEINEGKVFDAQCFPFCGKVLLHPTLMIRTDLMRKFPYREDLKSGVDFNLMTRLAMSGYDFLHTGTFHVLRREHNRNLTKTTNANQKQSAFLAKRLFENSLTPEKRKSLMDRARKIEAVTCDDRDDVQDRHRLFLPDHLAKRDVVVTEFEDAMLERAKSLGFKDPRINTDQVEVGGKVQRSRFLRFENVSLAGLATLRQIFGQAMMLHAHEAGATHLQPAENEEQHVLSIAANLLSSSGNLAAKYSAVSVILGKAKGRKWANGSGGTSLLKATIRQKDYTIRLDQSDTMNGAWAHFAHGDTPADLVGQFILEK